MQSRPLEVQRRLLSPSSPVLPKVGCRRRGEVVGVGTQAKGDYFSGKKWDLLLA